MPSFHFHTLLIILVLTFGPFSGHTVGARTTHTDTFAECDQCLEACNDVCGVDLHCDSKCKKEYEGCRARARVMSWLKSEVYTYHEREESVGEVCSSCQVFCTGIGVPDCVPKCRSFCEGSLEVRKESHALRGTI